MEREVSYRDYVTHDEMLTKYRSYQDRYASNIRESDKILIRMVADEIANHGDASGLSLLDIGCSTGNLLFHLKHSFQDLTLSGGDLAKVFVDGCKMDERMQGIEFDVMNMLALPEGKKYDIVIANAVAVYFDYDDYEAAVRSVSRVLKPGGAYLAFEWIHPFKQDLKIIETSRSHPAGLKIYFRPMERVEGILSRCGFSRVDFVPFRIPIDLNRGDTFTENVDGFEDLNSYTIRTESGDRLLFRGTLHQPWCHLIARKALCQESQECSMTSRTGITDPLSTRRSTP